METCKVGKAPWIKVDGRKMAGAALVEVVRGIFNIPPKE